MPLAWGMCLAVASLVAVPADLWGQVPKRPTAVPARAPHWVIGGGRISKSASAAAEEDVSENVFLPADRHTLQKLADSKRLLAEGRFSEAVRYLGDILEGPEDFFFQPEKNSSVPRSLKAEAQRLIGQMPPAGRELYELQYGAQARRMLDDALQTGDMASLAEVSRRFFHTQSGRQATFLLGLHHFDHGRPLAGAFVLQRLREAGSDAEEMEPELSLTMAACWLQAGAPEKARDTLVALRRQHPTLRVAVVGREVPIFTNDAEAMDWFVGLIGPSPAVSPAEAEHWLMFRGDAARNAPTTGGVPLLSVRWRVAMTNDPLMEAALEQYGRQFAEHGAAVIPALYPLAVGDVLLMRTAQNLLAVDFSTGKRLWEVPEEEVSETAGGVPAAELQMRQSMLLGGIEQRMWNDVTYGTLSSDGRSVFAIEDLDLGFGPGGNMVFCLGGARILGRNPGFAVVMPDQQTSSFCNRLAAYDIRTGKLKWHIGGPAGPHALRQKETFFLGPPLPLMGQLYVLGEIKGEVRLIAVDAATGNPLWSQQLAVAEQGVMQDPLRRWAGVSPSYADGVLVCPTSTGAIVGVELATRSLLWGYQYGRNRTENRMALGMPTMVGMTPGSPRWIDGSVSVVGDRVLATPREADFLYCLSLTNGRLLWKCPRQNDLYVACADREKVVLIGRRTVRALQMADGKPAWGGQTIDLPEGSMPSGRGFLAGDRYFLPLSGAEVIGIDLGAGKIVQTAKSRKGEVPGNLICYRGKVISQGLQGLEAYYLFDAVQTETQRRLAANPNDAEALSLQGETLLDSGKLSEAVAAFRRAYELSADPHTGQLLRDSLLEGLQTDFATYRDRGPELERLADNPAEQAAYLRLMAEGLRQAGQWASAFAHYEKLIDLEPKALPLDEVDKTLTVRRDRWLQCRLTLLRNASKGEATAQIDAAINARLKAVIADGSIEALERFLDYFGNQPAAAPARSQLVRRLNSTDRLLEAELRADDNAAESKPSRPSVAQEAILSQRNAQNTSWPVGKIETSTTMTNHPPVNPFGQFRIELRGSAEPFFSEGSIEFDENRHMLVGCDGYGHQQWQVALADDSQRANFGYNRTLSYARAQDHLLLVVLGWKVMAIDTLGSGGNNTPRLLWTQDLIRSGTDAANSRLFPVLVANLPWQWQNQLAQSHDRSSFLGPVTKRYICFQRLHGLVAVDPRDGQTLWARQDLPLGSDLFGDDQYVFVLSPGREEATLLRAGDGELLGTRRVPRLNGWQRLPNGELEPIFTRLGESCLATLGRRLLLWWPDGNQRVLTLVDPLEGRDVWPGRRFSAAARTCVVGSEAVGVFEPDGRFVLLGLPDGRTIAEVKLEAEPTLMDIALLASGGQYFLITRGGGGAHMAPIQPVPGGIFKPIYRGRLYAFDEQGKLSWAKPVVLKNQFLCADQPARLPILMFGSQAFEQPFNGQNQQKMSLLCVDKRNGRIAYKADFPNSAGPLDVTGNAQKKTVDLVMPNKIVTLTFTDKPLPPEPATDGRDIDSPKARGAAGDLWNSMQKTLERLLDRAGRNTSGEEEEKTDPFAE